MFRYVPLVIALWAVAAVMAATNALAIMSIAQYALFLSVAP